MDVDISFDIYLSISSGKIKTYVWNHKKDYDFSLRKNILVSRSDSISIITNLQRFVISQIRNILRESSFFFLDR